MITTVLPKVLRLTDAQLVALSKASQAADRCVQPPANLRGAAVSRFFGGLITRGLVDAVEGTGAPGEGDRIYAITALGLQAIGIDACGDGGADISTAELAIVAAAGNAQPAEASPQHVQVAQARKTDKGGVAQDGGAQHPRSDRATGEVDPAASELPGSRQPPVSAPRTASKLAQVIALLEREHGASAREIMCIDRLARPYHAGGAERLAQAGRWIGAGEGIGKRGEPLQHLGPSCPRRCGSVMAMARHPHRKPDAEHITIEIAELRDLDGAALRLAWRDATGKAAAPGLKGDLLVRAVA